MHGYAIHFLSGPEFRSNAATLAYSRPLRESKENEKLNLEVSCVRDKWY
jgi:hypothetical protein